MRTVLVMTIVLSMIGLPALAQRQPAAADFVVAPGGDDSNPGTNQKPFATLGRAKEAVGRRIAAGLESDLTVIIRGGTYKLVEPLVFGPADSGTEKFAVRYTASPGEKVLVSGGRKISGWKPADDGCWTAVVAGAREGKWCFRNLFVNGRRAVRARTPNKDDENPCRQLKTVELSKDLARFAITLPPGLLGNWRNPGDVEAMIAGNWAINRKRLESIDAARGVALMAPPNSSGPAYIFPSPGRWCCFENARELLDQPGEWYLDYRSGVLSYRPLSGEDMTRSEVVAPLASRLVEVTGTAERPVRNLHFSGIRFEHTNWQLPPGGYMGIQACHHRGGKLSGRRWTHIPAAIYCKYVCQSSFQDCVVARHSGCGIELAEGCHDNLVRGNHIFEISGNGLMVGGPNDEALVPADNLISNNHIETCGREYYGAVGIWVGFARGTVVTHNLVHDLPYTGVSVGWQWNAQPTACKQNLIEANHIYDVMKRLCDGGCIYTLGFQPGTVIRGNHLHDVRRSRYAQGAPNNGMFIDQGSKGYLFERNVIYNTAAELVRFNQCSRDWHTWRDNHFGKAAEVKEAGKQIIAAAGLQPQYRDR